MALQTTMTLTNSPSSTAVSKEIDFDIFEVIHIGGIRERFWSALRPWLMTRGYRLHPEGGFGALDAHELQLYDITDAHMEPYAYVADKQVSSRLLWPPQVRNRLSMWI